MLQNICWIAKIVVVLFTKEQEVLLLSETEKLLDCLLAAGSGRNEKKNEM
jgi:hypothetical protein